LVLGAQCSRADSLGIDVLFLRRVLGIDEGTAVGLRVLVHIDLRGPVDRRIVFFRNEELAIGSVECLGKSISIEMNQKLSRRPADVLVGEDHLIDTLS
jgi:hypothetical protein